MPFNAQHVTSQVLPWFLLCYVPLSCFEFVIISIIILILVVYLFIYLRYRIDDLALHSAKNNCPDHCSLVISDYHLVLLHLGQER